MRYLGRATCIHFTWKFFFFTVVLYMFGFFFRVEGNGLTEYLCPGTAGRRFKTLDVSSIHVDIP